ncbi:putative dsRNA-binding protein [Deinococcus arenicola]|uniref:DsRNA-binding protein n=1 Tax=Deinococcus arenicola TaxID=2994950 RepID=A0ABU4DLL7_9DEIO|nr:putative dsRNA-binding protein [Deinococcus sp. ZS9-10]MDV6373243.1 putative dsRNA-binding protein [Deinococcus sp. ZS9-10]
MNAKGELIARLVGQGQGAPLFEAVSHGPAHERTFHVQVVGGGRVLGKGGKGRSKRDAERLAAESAIRDLDGVAEPETQDGETEMDLSARWPIYSGVLEAALETALELAEEDATLDDVRADATRLYRDLLSDLGHGPEQDA